MLEMVVDDEEAENHEPSSCAAKLFAACVCWFVIVTVSVVEVPFVSVLTLFEHEYCRFVSHTPLHAANAGVMSNAVYMIAMVSMILFFMFFTEYSVLPTPNCRCTSSSEARTRLPEA